MAQHSSHILAMARKGAEHRYEELKAELAALTKHFPHIAGRAASIVSRGTKAVSATAAAAVARVAARKRRKMSARARAAISAAQKARWARQKASAGEPQTIKAGKKR